jgi:hypothetical protein
MDVSIPIGNLQNDQGLSTFGIGRTTMSSLEIAQGLVHRWEKGVKNPCIALYLSHGPRGQKLDRIYQLQW